MISKVVEKMLGSRKNSYLIPADMVANVSESNHLNHALLVLTKVKYAKIPVLDKKQHIKGLTFSLDDYRYNARIKWH